MFGVDKSADAALFLRLGQAMQSERRFTRGFRAVDFDDAAARQAADAERDIEAERTSGNGVDVHRLHVLAEPHDRALAEAALNLRQRGIKGFRFVHGRSFDETKCCTHFSRSLWPGFGGHERCGLPRRPMAIDSRRSVHDLFSVRNMFSLGLRVISVFPAPLPSFT